MKKVTLKYTTLHECSTSNSIKPNGYLTIPSIQGDTTSEYFRNTTYEADLPLIENEWEDYSRKYWEDYLNCHHNKSTKQILKLHIQKLNEVCFQKKPFEQ